MGIEVAIRKTFLDFIKVVGDNEHTYRETPEKMINAITEAVNQEIIDDNDRHKP